jgi:hypothetical protein
MGEMRKEHRISFRQLEGKTALERHGRRWEDDIKMDLKKKRMRMWIGFIWFKIESSGWLS